MPLYFNKMCQAPRGTFFVLLCSLFVAQRHAFFSLELLFRPFLVDGFEYGHTHSSILSVPRLSWLDQKVKP